MARGAQPVTLWPGWAVVALVAGFIAVAFAGVLSRADFTGQLVAADWAAIRFTLWQAVLSAVLSVVFAIPVARALSRRDFPGRHVLITLLGAPFLLPAMVAILGLLAIFGHKGWLNAGLQLMGLEPITIYGAHGVILAHVFYNLPLATRLILQGWQDIPSEHFRLAAQLGLTRWALFRTLELPMLRKVAPGALGLIFVLCLTSFAIALILGGGPRATTIELAIYQSFRFDFDLGRAALLSLIQLVLALTACLALFRVLPNASPGHGLGRPRARWDQAPWDLPVIALASVFLLAPMLSILGAGLPALASLPPQVWEAAFRSICVALTSAALLIVMALPLAALAARFGGTETVGLLGMATSPLMLGTGLFIIVYPFADPVALALVVTACVNAIMALPFAVRVLVPGLREAVQDFARLSASLGLTGWRLWRIVLLPRLRAPIGFALGLGAALSMGDLGVIALFADSDRATLPLAIERLLAGYRLEAAQGAALLLTALSFALFGLFDLWGRRNA